MRENSVQSSRIRIILILVIISVLTVAAYSQIIHSGFVSFDDTEYVVENSNIKNGLTLESIGWAITTKMDGNWFPLTWLSYMLDISIAGPSAQTFHVFNLLYHLINSSLLFIALYMMTGYINRSALVALLFALHPLHVESVAWISERKDLLSTFFFFLTIISYKKYLECKAISGYILILFLFICGLMSKSMLVTTPLILLLLDYWPLKRVNSLTYREYRKLLIEKIPFIIVSLLLCVITYNLQKHKAVVSFVDSPLLTNIENAVVSYVTYIYKTFVPIKLAVMYPFRYELSAFSVISAAISLSAVTVCVIKLKKERPYLIVGWFWYLISLLPVIGIIRVGKQSMADRYTYIPLVGFFILLVWGVSESRYIQKISMKIKTVIITGIFLALSILTWNQVTHWKTSISLFSHAVDVTENNWVALSILGYDYINSNDLNMASVLLNKSLSINPKNVKALYNMGLIQNKLGNFEQALQLFQETVKIEPDYWVAHYQIGLLLLFRGDATGAMYEYNIIKEHDPVQSRQLLSSIIIHNNSAASVH